MPEISVLVPSYNRASSYFPESIDSVLLQTFESFELVIGLDGPDPHDLVHYQTILSRHKSDPRVRCAIFPHRGTFATYNSLLELSKGKFICFFSDDDLMEKDFLRTCHKTLIDTGVDFAWSDCYFWDGVQIQSISTEINFNAILAKREALDKVRWQYGYYFVPDLKQYADVVLLYRFRKLGFRDAHVQQPLARWRIHEGQLTRNVTLRTILDHIHAQNLMDGASSRQTVAELRWLMAKWTGLGLAKNRLVPPSSRLRARPRDR